MEIAKVVAGAVKGLVKDRRKTTAHEVASCNNCEDKAKVNRDLDVVWCLSESEQCPEGYF